MNIFETLQVQVAENRLRQDGHDLAVRGERLDDLHGDGRYVGSMPERLGERAGYLFDAADAVRRWRCG